MSGSSAVNTCLNWAFLEGGVSPAVKALHDKHSTGAIGGGVVTLITASIGVSTWTVFAQGITHLTGWSIGLATFMISLLVLLCWLPLKQVPGIEIVSNAIIIALVLEYLLLYLPTYENPILRIGEALLGVLVTGFGGGLYLAANLGPGPAIVASMYCLERVFCKNQAACK